MDCTKCGGSADNGSLTGIDSTKPYCKDCFIEKVKQKFAAAIGRTRIFKRGCENRGPKKALIVYEGNPQSAFLISQIAQSLNGNPNRRFEMYPTVLMILSCTNEEKLGHVFGLLGKLKELIDVQWIVCHMSALFEENLESVDKLKNKSRVFFGKDMIQKWKCLLDSCKSESVRTEFIRLCRLLLTARVAAYLEIDNVILPDSADFVVNCTLSSLAFGRGSKVHNSACVLDKCFNRLFFIRPLRNISNREVSLMNRFHGTEKYTLILGYDSETKNSLQKCSYDFIHELQSKGYIGVMSTILSITSKLQSRASKNTYCHFCGVPGIFLDPTSQGFCCSCYNVTKEIDNNALVDELFSTDKFFTFYIAHHPRSNAEPLSQ